MLTLASGPVEVMGVTLPFRYLFLESFHMTWGKPVFGSFASRSPLMVSDTAIHNLLTDYETVSFGFRQTHVCVSVKNLFVS